mgnify:CR=1 FL=1
MNLEKTASIKSVTTDTKILDAKRVETAELLVDGVSISEIVPKWKPREHIYRCVLEEDDDYIIYDDEGNFLDCKLDKLENGSSLFRYAKGVENFSFSLPSLTNGNSMFANSSFKSLNINAPNLSDGTGLFGSNQSLAKITGDLSSLANGDMLPVIIFGVVVGFILAKLKEETATINKLFTEGNTLMMEMTNIVMKFAPIGVFCLIAKTFATLGMDGLMPLSKYVACVILALAVQAFIVYPTLLVIFTRLNPIKFFKKFFSVMLFAFSSSSSNATIPLNLSKKINTKLKTQNYK